MSYDVGAAADTFYDKWLPCFSESALGWADRFHREILAALHEAHQQGIQDAERCPICGRPRHVHPREDSDCQRLDTHDPSVGTPTASKVNWNYGEIGRRLVPVQEMPAAPESVYLSGQGWGKSSGGKPCGHHETNPCGCATPTNPKYVCPMKRPSGAPKKCELCRKMRSETPGECDCCGAALILAPLTADELRAAAGDPCGGACDCPPPTAPPAGSEPK